MCARVDFDVITVTMLMSAFLMRLKADHLEKICGIPDFSLRIPKAHAKIYFFHVVLIWYKPLYLEGTILNISNIIHRCDVELIHHTSFLLASLSALSSSALENTVRHFTNSVKNN